MFFEETDYMTSKIKKERVKLLTEKKNYILENNDKYINELSDEKDNIYGGSNLGNKYDDEEKKES